MTPLIILILGLLIIFLEFFLPGGILAVIGIILVLTSIVLSAMHYNSPLSVMLFVIVDIVGVVVVCAGALLLLRRSKPLTGWYSQKDQEGFKASDYNNEAMDKVGKALSDLKPSGHVIIEGKRYQALSQSGYIEEGSDIIVIGGQGAHLLVKLHKMEIV